MYTPPRKGQYLKCTTCEKVFYRKRTEISTNNFCSRPCYNIWNKRNFHSYPKSGGKHLHRIMVEKALGCPLPSGAIVHHIDGNKQNWDPINLKITDHCGHAKIHFTGTKQSPEHIAKRMASSIATKAGRLYPDRFYTQNAIFDRLSTEPMKLIDIAHNIGKSQSNTGNALHELILRNKVIRVGHGLYKIKYPEEGLN